MRRRHFLQAAAAATVSVLSSFRSASAQMRRMPGAAMGARTPRSWLTGSGWPTGLPLRRLGILEDTLIFYIGSDNGASAEGQAGTISELLAQNLMLLTFRFTRWQTDVERMLEGNGYLAVEFISALTVAVAPGPFTLDVERDVGRARLTLVRRASPSPPA